MQCGLSDVHCIRVDVTKLTVVQVLGLVAVISRV
jgi:hypothetical protein